MPETVVGREFVWDRGKTAEELAEKERARAARLSAETTGRAAKTQAQLTFWKVTWAVFMGNLFFAIVATIVYEISQH